MSRYVSNGICAILFMCVSAASLSLPTSLYEQPNTELITFTFDPARRKSVFNSFASLFS